jgi:hypothetical protein
MPPPDNSRAFSFRQGLKFVFQAIDRHGLQYRRFDRLLQYHLEGITLNYQIVGEETGCRWRAVGGFDPSLAIGVQMGDENL